MRHRETLPQSIAMNCLRVAALSVVIVAATMPPVASQTVEDREVISLSSQELGPYRPQERPVLEEVEKLIVEQTNTFREDHDLQPLETHDLLHKTASEFADYMARKDRYGHQADGRSPAQRAEQHEYPLCLIAENIAYSFGTEGFQTEELTSQTVKGWIDSPPHRRNMLNEHVTDIGVAVAQSEQTGVFYAVQMFGRPRSEAIRFAITNSAEQTVTYMLADQQHSLPPRYTRVHEMCIPHSLALKNDKNDAPVHDPADGERLVVRQSDTGLVVEPETDEGDRQ
jgi:uncharacterized protein YkwD